MKKEKFAWSAKIIPGKKEEYISRHNHIWPEMKKVLKSAGIVNYTIWVNGNTLFGYYECLKGVKYATKVQANSPVVKKWNKYMKDVMIMETDKKKFAQSHLEKVFELK